MQTETIDRLFLELSQFTTAKTAREIQLENELAKLNSSPSHAPAAEQAPSEPKSPAQQELDDFATMVRTCNPQSPSPVVVEGQCYEWLASHHENNVYRIENRRHPEPDGDRVYVFVPEHGIWARSAHSVAELQAALTRGEAKLVPSLEQPVAESKAEPKPKVRKFADENDVIASFDAGKPDGRGIYDSGVNAGKETMSTLRDCTSTHKRQFREIFDPETGPESKQEPTAREISDDEKEAQRRSFAYGNAAIDNPNVTREIVDQEADKLANVSAPESASTGRAKRVPSPEQPAEQVETVKGKRWFRNNKHADDIAEFVGDDLDASGRWWTPDDSGIRTKQTLRDVLAGNWTELPADPRVKQEGASEESLDHSYDNGQCVYCHETFSSGNRGPCPTLLKIVYASTKNRIAELEGANAAYDELAKQQYERLNLKDKQISELEQRAIDSGNPLWIPQGDWATVMNMLFHFRSQLSAEKSAHAETTSTLESAYKTIELEKSLRNESERLRNVMVEAVTTKAGKFLSIREFYRARSNVGPKFYDYEAAHSPRLESALAQQPESKPKTMLEAEWGTEGARKAMASPPTFVQQQPESKPAEQGKTVEVGQ